MYYNQENEERIIFLFGLFFMIVIFSMALGTKSYLKNRKKERFYNITKPYEMTRGLQKQLIASLYLLPKLRSLILKYDGVNEMLVGLKKLFLLMEKKEKNPALYQLLADVSPSEKDPIANLPFSTVREVFLNGAIVKDKQTYNIHLQDIEFLKLFLLKNENYFEDLPYLVNDFFRIQFCAKNLRCIRKDCPTKIYDKPGDEKTKDYNQMPEYYITEIFPVVTSRDFDPLKRGFLKKIYPFNHIAYVLDSFHVRIAFYVSRKCISCYKTADNKWFNMFDGNEVEEEHITSLLSNKTNYIELFYRKME